MRLVFTSSILCGHAAAQVALHPQTIGADMHWEIMDGVAKAGSENLRNEEGDDVGDLMGEQSDLFP